MAKQEQIKSLDAAGWSQRRIAKHLGIHRGTVSRCIKKDSVSKAAITTTGSEGDIDQKKRLHHLEQAEKVSANRFETSSPTVSKKGKTRISFGGI